VSIKESVASITIILIDGSWASKDELDKEKTLETSFIIIYFLKNISFNLKKYLLYNFLVFLTFFKYWNIHG